MGLSRAFRVVVAGAGPAGLMAAGTAAGRGFNVTVFDPNGFPGRKLLMTGKGRCNLCNDCDVRTCLENTPTNPRFLHSALSRFQPSDVMRFFEGIGVPLKTERGGRVFPVSDKASDVVDALWCWASGLGVRLLRGRVTDLLLDHGQLRGVRTDQGDQFCDRIIIATGGLSYPETGSTGDGYRLAERAGHTVVSPGPSLVPLLSSDSACASLSGLGLRNVAISLLDCEGRLLYSDFGELLFTHFGLSGPTALSASAHMRRGKPWTVVIDLKPALDHATLDARMLRDFGSNPNRNLGKTLGALLPKAMVPEMLRLAEIPADKKVHSVTKYERARLRSLLKAFPVEITDLAPNSCAVVTSGGVKTGEIDPKTMASRLVAGLYFAGEVIDADALTGGFNLQIAWSTGYTAGGATV